MSLELGTILNFPCQVILETGFWAFFKDDWIMEQFQVSSAYDFYTWNRSQLYFTDYFEHGIIFSLFYI
jgi:hypothetical protein